MNDSKDPKAVKKPMRRAPSKLRVMRPKTSWGGVAEWYDSLLSEGGTYQQDVILPNLLRLMGMTSGQRVADIACGPGFFSGAFVKAGAEVHGTDISAELVVRARHNVPGAIFDVAPAHKLSGIESGWADHATIVLAIQNVEDDRAALAEAARVIKTGGRLHLVLNHPAFRIPKRTSWGWDHEGKRQYRRVDGYLTESRAEISMKPGSDPSVRTVSFHRPLQHYVKSLVRAGFVVNGLEEWISMKVSDSGPRAGEENRARREFPMFLYLQAVKA